MTIMIGRHGIVGDIRDEVARLEALTLDLSRIADGHMPSPAALEGAPLLDPYNFATRPRPCLIGGIHGHPTLKGPLSVTSEVWAFAPDFGWARTLSRFYQLGRQLGEGRHS